MNVPLDNLYTWVDGLLPDPACVYVFRPHGSKKISDFDFLKIYDQDTMWEFPAVIMHDQEPLDWNLYNHPDQYVELDSWTKRSRSSECKNLGHRYFSNFNLKSLCILRSPAYDFSILIHSEKNSEDLERYQQIGLIGVHYWSHAVLSRDWYRFAEHDTRLCSNMIKKNNFLIYCRDWSHRREYRLKFIEMLVENKLDQHSQISLMHTNSENTHFLQHKFLNPKFKLTKPELISKIHCNQFDATASADYDYIDYVTTYVSVVLETVFDGSRIHLTEKTLRPIACGHPFILAAGPGSLEYIKSYGFKTFDPWIDESYDNEQDSYKRLEKIIQTMKKIQNLQGQELEIFIQGIKQIAEFNKKHFFSLEFFNLLKNELKNNLCVAHKKVKKSQGKYYLEYLKLVKKHKLLHQMKYRRQLTALVKQLRRHGRGGLSNPWVDPLP